MLRDQHRLRRAVRDLEQRATRGDDVATERERIEARIRQSVAERERRAVNLPRPELIDDLPVNQKREEIAQAIAQHQVVVICGETGSGKTTQLPKICLALGRGAAGLIGHTQPRRIAARSVATRIAQELNSSVGQAVGYKVRFTDHTRPETYVKVMTDGILLAEVQTDRFLNQYDTLIIDEAHERSLNIDFLLGYLKNLLPKRPGLKLIVTSATIDPARFAKHFSDAPVLEVSGRMYPVETRYRPRAVTVEDEEGEDELTALLHAVDEVAAEGGGDILVFLSGEREIREVAEALRKHHPPETQILPLYSRLSAAEQMQVFTPHAGRRIVLATNVAETSLTVPGIRYVVDTGTARISRYSHRSKIQRLPVEPVSQASAEQRKGRCGRVGPGVCVRLYSEEDFNTRPRYTDPEILRTNLANVILQMKALRLGDIESFPFIDPPDGRYIRDGVRLLEELQAIDAAGELTTIGKQLARFPVDPRLGRMLIAAHQWGCLREVRIIVSGLSVQDPRERPLDKQQQADEAHRHWQDEKSDFVALLNLWKFFDEQHHHLTRSKLRQLCRKRFLSYTRMLEWRDIHAQLVTLCNELELRENQIDAQYYDLHQALLTGMLGNIGMRGDDKEYLGARGLKFHIFPGSGLFKKAPRWIMAAQLTETTRVYAHGVAAIEPQWIEHAAAHLIKRSWFEPHWEKARGEAAVYERVTLYGLPIVTKRKVNYGRIDPRDAREIFIRSALVQGDYDTHAAFFQHNRALMDEVQTLEHKTRRQDILVDETTLFAFYDARIPPDIFSARRFEQWLREEQQRDPNVLHLTRDTLLRAEAETARAGQFPDALVLDGARLALSYRFEPGQVDDGVTVTVPRALIHQLELQRFEWLVPGLLRERVIELIRALPKSLRRNFVPVPRFADAILEAAPATHGSLHEYLARELERMTGVRIPRDAWNESALSPHLRMNIRVVDEQGATVAQGRDAQQLWGQVETSGAAPATRPEAAFERDGITLWDFGELDASVELLQQGVRVRRFPALMDANDSVSLRLFETQILAANAHRAGVRRLIALHLPQQMKYLRKNLPAFGATATQLLGVVRADALQDDVIMAVLDAAFFADRALPRTADDFTACLDAGRAAMVDHANRLCALLARIATEYRALRTALSAAPPGTESARQDLEAQLQRLFHANFVATTPAVWLERYPVYLAAARIRVDKWRYALAREDEHRAALERLTREYSSRPDRPGLDEFNWLLEELRVSLFAQELKTIRPVSVRRLEKLLEESRRG